MERRTSEQESSGGGRRPRANSRALLGSGIAAALILSFVPAFDSAANLGRIVLAILCVFWIVSLVLGGSLSDDDDRP